MSEEQLYRVKLYAGESLIEVKADRTYDEACSDIEEWADKELNRYAVASPDIELPSNEPNTVNPLMVLPSALFMVTFITSIGEINIVTNDGILANNQVNQFIHELGTMMGEEITIDEVIGPTPTHVVVINDRVEYNSLDVKEIYESMQPIEGAETTIDE